ncbi:MAG TPA: glycosyltransferase family 39 protein [Gemmatimonadaceae bacterium]
MRREPLWRDRGIVALIAILSSIAGIANGFVFDDIPQVAENARVQGLGRIGEILTSPYWPPPFAPELYRPVASITVAIQYVLGAGQPEIFRVVSYLLYALTAIGVFELGRRVMPRPIALGLAVLFAADPVHVEAVALAVNQGELIVACAATSCVIVYLDRRRTDAGALSLRDWVTLCALFAVGALAKENGFVIPGLIVVAELCLVNASSVRARARTTWKGYASMAVVGLVLLATRAAVLSGNVTGALPAKAIAGLSLAGRLLTMLQIVPRWVRLFVWPAHLQIDYSPNEIVASTRFGAYEMLGLALLVAFVAIAWLARRRAPVVTFGLAFCAVALFPVSNIVPTGIVLAERTLFLPSVGFLIAIGGAVAFALSSAKASTINATRGLVALCAGFVVLGAVRSDNRQLTWRNGQAMWAAAAVDAPKSLRVKQAHDEAVADLVRDFEREAQQSPTPWRVQFQLGTLLRFMNADSAAMTQLRTSLASHAEQQDAALELSATLISVGNYAEAKLVAEAINSTGDTARVAQRFVQLADSASTAHSPPGSVRIIARQALAGGAK